MVNIEKNKKYIACKNCGCLLSYLNEDEIIIAERIENKTLMKIFGFTCPKCNKKIITRKE